LSYFKLISKSEATNRVRQEAKLGRQFYCYALLDKGIPFYVGIGSNPRRIASHVRKEGGKNTFKTNKIQSMTLEGRELQYSIVAFFHSWVEAYHAEKSLILFYGRRNVRSDGILTNLTDGGEGTPGWVVTDEIRKGMSERAKGKVRSEEAKRKTSEALKEYYKNNPNPCLGKKYSDEHKKKLSDMRKGDKHPAWGKFGKDNPKYDSKVSEEALENMKRAQAKRSSKSKQEGNTENITPVNLRPHIHKETKEV